MDGRVEPKASDGDLEGLDDTQRAEVHAYEGGGPTDGDVLTDMTRDRGEDYVEDDRPSEMLSGPTDPSTEGDRSGADDDDAALEDDDLSSTGLDSDLEKKLKEADLDGDF